MTRIPVTRALVSVSDKTGLVDFARRLDAAGVEILSSGGTARHLADAGIPVTEVAEVTGAPEMLGGRVKTLHPNIHGAILAELDDEQHRADLEARGIEPIQLVVAGLYPFEDDPSIEHIDIGGPTMIRAAAKNHRWVGIVVSPDRYDEVAAAVEAGGLDENLRLELARDAFSRTAAYENAIAGWFGALPTMEHARTLRYGENPHQSAALYAERGADGWWQHAKQLQGKEMSFNNYADTEAAWRLAADLPGIGAVVVKHANPSGAAVGEDALSAFRAAWECDPVSGFGGVIALNAPLDSGTADAIIENFVEVVIAPSVDPAAAEVLATKKNLRVLEAPFASTTDLDVRRLDGGYLVQERDTVGVGAWEVASDRIPTDRELGELRLAWIVAAHTKSNAIVIVKDRAAVGVGAGDQSRVGAAERALVRAGERSQGAVAASDGFFPFRDGIDRLAEAGITAIVEPGGSVKDEEVIAAADEHGVALLFTGRRHFLH